MFSPSPADQPLTYTVAQAAALLGISETHAYRLIRRGEFPVIRLGGRLVVPRVALEALCASGIR